MCSERDSPLKRLYRRTHAKLTRPAGSGQLVWAAGCKLSLALVHAWRPAWPGETSETILRVAPPRKTRPPDHTRVNWPVDASASGSAQVRATDEPREFRLARSRQDKRLERAIPLTTHLWSEWSTILLPTRVRLVVEVLRYIIFRCVLFYRLYVQDALNFRNKRSS